MIVGQDRAVEQFASAWTTRKLHHAWLLAGPKGVGKASFARAAARRVLADAAGPPFGLPGIQTSGDHPIVKLVEAGSHPDMRWLERLPREKGEGLARDITIKQVRALGEFMGMRLRCRPGGRGHRQHGRAEQGSVQRAAQDARGAAGEHSFLLVSHAPGRLLPTIRSRCRRVDFQKLDADAMTSILESRTALGAAERQRVIAMSFGSAGRALAFAELGLARLEDAALAILRQGDPTNARRSDLATELGKRAARDRYAAFLDLAPR